MIVRGSRPSRLPRQDACNAMTTRAQHHTCDSSTLRLRRDDLSERASITTEFDAEVVQRRAAR